MGDIQPCEPGRNPLSSTTALPGSNAICEKERRSPSASEVPIPPRTGSRIFPSGKRPSPYDNQDTKVRVHEGFLRVYKSPAVREITGQVSQELIHIGICGHSFGAALAILCAVDLQYCFPHKDIQVITFGCSPSGKKTRLSKGPFDKRVFKAIRVVNGNDIVHQASLCPLWDTAMWEDASM